MTSKKLKLAVALLFANAAICAGYVAALYKGVELPLGLGGRQWLDVLPDVVLVVLLSLVAAWGMVRRTTPGFAVGLLAAGVYMGGPGSNVVRFIVIATQTSPEGAPARPIPFVSIYFTLFGLGLAIYLWSRRRVFAVGV